VPSIGCTSLGETKTYFPNGEPQGCDLNSVGFQLVFQLTTFFRWLIIVVSAYYGKRTLNFSIATAGATMIVKGTIDLIKAIGFQYAKDSAIQILNVVVPVRAWVTYGVAAIGFLGQKYLLEAKEDGKGFDRKDPQPKACSLLCGGLLKLCYRIDECIGRNLQTMKALKDPAGMLVKAASSKKNEATTKKKDDGSPEFKARPKEAEKAAPAAANATELQEVVTAPDVTA
jgi:hypothetical protein